MTKTFNRLLFICSLTQTLVTAYAANLSAPGLIESYEKLLSIDDIQSNKANSLVAATKKADFDSSADLRLNSYFLRSIILNSDSRYLQLAERGECAFLSLMENGLLKWTAVPATSVLVDSKNKKGELTTSTLPLTNFLQLVYRTKCVTNREQSELFSDKNLTNSVSALTLVVPKTEAECRNVFDQWRASSSLPYLCRFHEILQNGQKAQKALLVLDEKEIGKRHLLQESLNQERFIESNIPFFQRSYISNLCKNLDNEKNYCASYVGQDTWNKVTSGELPLYTMSYLCQDILKKNELTTVDLISCAARIKESPQICHSLNIKNQPALFPKAGCQEAAQALDVAHLKTNFRDCPGAIDTEGITNLFRLQKHFAPENALFPKNDCLSDPYFSFAKMTIDFAGDTDNWPLKICYHEPVLKKEKCEAYIPGNNPNEKMSEGFIIGKILSRLKGAPEKTTCQVVDINNYKPSLLQFQVGCYIVRDTNRCSGPECERKIYYDKNLISGINFRGVFTYEYFSNSYTAEKFSAHNILLETYRLQGKTLKNLTELSFFLSQYKTAVVHGIGCVEDLLPAYFTRSSLNQCRPIPFIIDGVVKKNNNNFLSIRTAVDDLHLPRLISWGFIFSSISNYRELHPLQRWTLYGLK